jgi:hypothetical protein
MYHLGLPDGIHRNLKVKLASAFVVRGAPSKEVVSHDNVGDHVEDSLDNVPEKKKRGYTLGVKTDTNGKTIINGVVEGSPPRVILVIRRRFCGNEKSFGWCELRSYLLLRRWDPDLSN